MSDPFRMCPNATDPIRGTSPPTRQVFNKGRYGGENESDQFPIIMTKERVGDHGARAMSCTQALVQTVAFQVKGLTHGLNSEPRCVLSSSGRSGPPEGFRFNFRILPPLLGVAIGNKSRPRAAPRVDLVTGSELVFPIAELEGQR